ncbi:phosphoinositide phosphatase SAC1 isoform X1 [Olea europaea var. sylvestris]|uniref:phosphoinositide phosphatase SAC1 isoform X1 n=1 Tax=Olea europaea var. sylvestris TaxID=158386 RepID=UPI000C1D1E6B|nr:phosphoinositide phosphatase SAC1 isoform X1 [Olea europaea var. sylvestris]XP_022875966.1 phosphoinositide phosphatase SAC1 isoform X1 [Olea europaea var. sylvestris]
MAKPENSKSNSANLLPKSGSISSKIHPANDPETVPDFYSLEKFRLHETRARFYLIGSDRNKRLFRVLKIDRMEPSDLNISEDPVVYPPQEVKSLLQRIAEGNRATGGLNFVAKVYGIVGCIKFLESYYLILVKKRRQIGCICGHAIYSIEESLIITIPHVSVQTDVAHSKTEQRYKKLLSSVDLTKDFFYSYTYPIMQCLQKNVLSTGEEGMPYENMFVWNAYLTQAIRSRCKNTIWTIALVHGNFKQVRLSIFGRDFSIALVSRRSRHFAGTRYLKRGVNDHGRVANDVETEQIVLDEEAGTCKGKMSSVVQMRGSIPLFWSQEASRFSPKPDIILQRYDPTYEATKLHFEDLARRYGNPIIVLNLIKTVEKRPREMMLRREFANAVGYLNQILLEENHLKFIHWDFHKFAKSKSANVLAVLGGVASEALDLTGFYYSGKPVVVKKRRTVHLSRTSTRRDASLRDLTANSGELSRVGSGADTLNSLPKLDREFESGQRIGKDINGNSVPLFQSGVLRTNCIDCLDRTNVAQYAYGLAALGRQLHAMGLTDNPKVDVDSSIAGALMDMYQSMGDALAQQYGGSAAHNTVFTERQGKWKATTHSREFLKSIKRYYSNAYTDGEKQDAINLFLGYFQPQEGKPALWELDSDYYLHVSGIGDDLIPKSCSYLDEPKPLGAATPLAPIPACREDFSRMKLTSFDELIERTCSSIKNVRLCSELEQKSGSYGVAPDAAEIQLKSPNWLFGQRKYEGSSSAPKLAPHEVANGGVCDEKKIDGLSDLNLFSPVVVSNEEDIFRRYLAMTTVDEANGWYGGTLLGDQDESSEIYRHYAELIQGPAMEPFQNDLEKEQYYADLLGVSTVDCMDDSAAEAEMEAAFKEYDRIGSDLGIFPKSCKALVVDPSQLTRWIVGEDRLSNI